MIEMSFMKELKIGERIWIETIESDTVLSRRNVQVELQLPVKCSVLGK